MLTRELPESISSIGPLGISDETIETEEVPNDETLNDTYRSAELAMSNALIRGARDEDISAILKMWDIAYKKAWDIDWQPQEISTSEYGQSHHWEETYTTFDTTLEKLMHVAGSSKILPPPKKTFDGVARFQSLIEDPDFTESAQLGFFVHHTLLKAYLGSQDHYSSSAEINRSKAKYEKTLEFLKPVLKAALITHSSQKGMPLRGYLESLRSCEEQDLAFELLLSSLKSETDLQNYAVELMNVFGIVPTIEFIAAHASYHADLRSLYSYLHGEELDEIMESLSQVYSSVDFEHYELNNSELTKQEALLIKEQIDASAEERPLVLDIGGGTGRHAAELTSMLESPDQKPFDLLVVEYEEAHVRKINRSAPNAKVVVADWHRLPLPRRSATQTSPDVFYCLGRTLPHNNTPEKMFRFFDELSGVTSEAASGLIDLPNIDDLKQERLRNPYTENISKYRKHLNAIGVEDTQTNLLFDGPDETHKYDRMTLSEKQLKAFAALFGFNADRISAHNFTEDNFSNSYYLLQKQDFQIDYMPPSEFRRLFKVCGLAAHGTDFNMYIESWGLPLGVVLICMAENRPLDLQSLRIKYKKGELGKIHSFKDENGDLFFEMSQTSS